MLSFEPQMVWRAEKVSELLLFWYSHMDLYECSFSYDLGAGVHDSVGSFLKVSLSLTPWKTFHAKTWQDSFQFNPPPLKKTSPIPVYFQESCSWAVFFFFFNFLLKYITCHSKVLLLGNSCSDRVTVALKVTWHFIGNSASTFLALSHCGQRLTDLFGKQHDPRWQRCHVHSHSRAGQTPH